jgi:hypothetical protein
VEEKERGLGLFTPENDVAQLLRPLLAHFVHPAQVVHLTAMTKILTALGKNQLSLVGVKKSGSGCPKASGKIEGHHRPAPDTWGFHLPKTARARALFLQTLFIHW